MHIRTHVHLDIMTCMFERSQDDDDDVDDVDDDFDDDDDDDDGDDEF